MPHASLIPRALLRGAIAALTCAGGLTVAFPAAAQEPCFERLDNGIDMTGWQRSTTNHHGPGLGWTVEDGALVGRQTTGQLGGILMTDRMYQNVEVVFEVKIDWSCDSGFFFRTTAGDRAYQVTIDHLTGGTVGGIYGESFATLVQALDFTLTDLGSTAVVAPGRTPIFDLAAWPTIWHPTDWNEMRARIEGNPPHIQVWISNLKVADFTDAQVRNEIALAGPLAIQVHGGDRFIAGGAVRFRNVRAKDLNVVCAPDAGDASPGAGQPEAATASDAKSIDDARSIDDAPGDRSVGAAADVGSRTNPSPGSDAETAPDAPASGAGATSGAGSGSGCACGTSRSRADTNLALLLLLASAGAMRHRRSPILRRASALAFTATLVACSGGNESPTVSNTAASTSGPGSSGSGGTGSGSTGSGSSGSGDGGSGGVGAGGTAGGGGGDAGIDVGQTSGPFQIADPVRIDSGLVSGTAGRDASITVFKGIPFAAPPVGTNRWKPPQSVGPWPDVRKADKFGNICMQATQAPFQVWTEEFIVPPDLAYSEDCLNLNVWTDKSSTNGKRPVYLFIHGGAYVSGSGSCAVYDGEGLAKKGVVVVTTNYRLGNFGFLAHPELTVESPNHASGNYALLDMIAALEWIKRNIAQFGGDPGNVTVGGQSAGSGAVHMLTMSPLAKGLIRGAITESLNMITAGNTSTLASKEAAGTAAFSGKTLAEMRAMSAAAVLAVTYMSGPVIDGYSLPGDLLATLKAGMQNDVAMISGMVRGDAPSTATTLAAYRSSANATYGAMSADFLVAYPATDDASATAQAAVVAVDKQNALEYALARARAAHGNAKTYLYYFDHSMPPPPNAPQSTGAFHTADVPYTFNYFYKPVDVQKLRPWTQTDYDLGQAMSSYWASFAAKQDPNGAGLSTWAPYSGEIQLQELGDSVRPLAPLDNAKASFWKAYYASQLGI